MDPTVCGVVYAAAFRCCDTSSLTLSTVERGV